MKLHRISKKGFKMVMVERSENDLKNRLIKMGHSPMTEKYFHIHRKEYGDSYSKNCWYIFLKGKILQDWKKGL